MGSSDKFTTYKGIRQHPAFSFKAIDAMMDIAYRIDRCLRAAAEATGAGMEIVTEPGYLPIQPLKDVSVLEDVFEMVDPTHKNKISRLPKCFALIAYRLIKLFKFGYGQIPDFVLS